MPYGLYVTQGQGSGPGPDLEFETLEDALAHVRDHEGEASFGIKYPDGSWHQWSAEDQRVAAEAMFRKNRLPASIQRAADAAEMVYYQNNRGDVWTWRRVVMTIARELREPTDEMCDAGNASTASWLDLEQRGLRGIEAQREKYRLRWRAMMDRLIGDGIPEFLYERARLRPANYASLSPQEQWDIDKRLGILDWDGSDDRENVVK